MSNLTKLLTVGGAAGEVVPEAIDYTKAFDYLSRASALVGNADGTTFTFSCWFYLTDATRRLYLFSSAEAAGSNNKKIDISLDGNDVTLAVNQASGFSLFNKVTAITVPLNTWCSLIVSLNTAVPTSGRIALNETVYTIDSGTIGGTMLFDVPAFRINYGVSTGASGSTCRVAHTFLDYTYRDLSIEANRRLFITEDLKPASGQADLNPIMYLPMKDVDTWHVNEGTGGDFTPNGTVAVSGRGPNQSNCVASNFNGTNEFLKHAGISTTNSNEITLSFVFKPTIASAGHVYVIGSGGTVGELFHVNLTQFRVRFIGPLTSSSNVFYWSMPSGSITTGKHYAIQLSFSLSDVATFALFINGEQTAIAPVTFIDNTIPVNGQEHHVCGSYASSAAFTGVVGEVWFDNAYTDLVADNPFWDSDLNIAKPVRQVIEETGVTPLVALPIEAATGGLNLGTGGEFTAYYVGNYTPTISKYLGARGASEFWARSADFGVNAGRLKNEALSGISSSKTVSLVFCYNRTADYNTFFYFIDTSLANNNFSMNINGQKVGFQAEDATSTIINKAVTNVDEGTGAWNTVFVSIDTADINKFHVFLNGVEEVMTGSIFIDRVIPFGSINSYRIAGYNNDANDMQGALSVFYFTTEYIDFTDEDNRLLFVDALGYPTNIQEKIDNGDVPAPLIYMPFDAPDNLGKNNGIGGDFTVNGTVVPGADVDIYS